MFNLPKEEEKVLKFWKENKIFERSLQNKEKKFVFYEGPPTANGEPGLHHVLARVFKDIICRYKTMQGYRVDRKAGWDTHGLPVELEVEKEIGINSKKDIEEHGVDKFNKKCKESVWKYEKQWEDLTERIGFWIDMENPYITYQPDYMESLFWIMGRFYEKGLLYRNKKVVPWCPRCQTSLSSHEVSQGYKKVKDPAIYVKFEITNGGFENKQKTYLLAWTTTPWTLSGNVALAINPALDYALVRVSSESGEEEGEQYILAKEKVKDIFEEGSFVIVNEFKGKELTDLKYSGLYPDAQQEENVRLNEILPADFVSAEEGTGIVHIAPAFGEDDYNLIQEENSNSQVQFPIRVTVTERGEMDTPGYSWNEKFFKEADPFIIEELRKRNLLLKEDKYEHDYPFCWRCKSPLLYYLHTSWYVGVSEIKNNLINNNQKINWVPSHLKEGRFGNFLEEVRDWNFSRERYWGTPLPVWECGECGAIEVIDSRESLKEKKFSNNKYFILRHGLAEQNVKGIVNSSPENSYSLTKIGKTQVKRTLNKIKDKEKIDFIFSSDLQRCKETAEIIGKHFGVEVKTRPDLRDFNFGSYEGKSTIKYWRDFPASLDRFSNSMPGGGESWNQCKKRVFDVLEEIEKNYENKNILIVSHGDPLWLLEGAVNGLTNEELLEYRSKNKIKKAELREIEYKKFPYNQEGEMDFHRPFIDEVEFYCSHCSKEKMKRVLPVVDCWFDSGSMPFAQNHWPFESNGISSNSGKNSKEVNPPEDFPADYICEAIDQTRGWFYTLLAVSSLLGFGNPYKNVISLGHVLDSKGLKMAKSKGNVVKPQEAIDKYGVDTLRWFFFTVNQPENSKRFDEKEIKKNFNRFILTLYNSCVFYERYASQPGKIGEKGGVKKRLFKNKSNYLLDRWILSRFQKLTSFVQYSLEDFDVVKAAREIENFVVNDFSNWYIRLSRKRFQRPESKEDLNLASDTLRFIFIELLKMCAPFVPFVSEILYNRLRPSTDSDRSSVHLENYPKIEEDFVEDELEEKMDRARDIVTKGLAKRREEGIKVRQPLQKIKFNDKELSLEEEIKELMKQELNVKNVVFDSTLRKGEVKLDTEITIELRNEGFLREVIRKVQEMRKSAGLSKEDSITVSYGALEERGEDLTIVIDNNKETVKDSVLAKEVTKRKKGPYLAEEELQFSGRKIWLGIK